MSREIDIAYAAGVIDSDGTIGVRRSTYGMRTRGDSSPNYSVRIKVKQVSPEAVTLLKELFGGQLRIERPQATARRHLYHWEIRDRLAEACLIALLPYLRIKQQQAENCLELRDLIEEGKRQRVPRGRGRVGSNPRDPAMSAAMERLFLRAKELNVVGARACQ